MKNNTSKIKIENKNEKIEEYYLKWLGVKKEVLIPTIEELIKQINPDETKKYTIRNLNITPARPQRESYYNENYKLEGTITDGEKVWGIELSLNLGNSKKLKISRRHGEKNEYPTTEKYYRYEKQKVPKIILEKKIAYMNCLEFSGMFLMCGKPNTYVVEHDEICLRICTNPIKSGMIPTPNYFFEELKDNFRYHLIAHRLSHNEKGELNIDESVEEQIIKEMLTINDKYDAIRVIKNMITILKNTEEIDILINTRDYENGQVKICMNTRTGKISLEIDLPDGRKYIYESKEKETDIEATLETISNELSQIIKIIEKSKKKTRKK